MRNTVIPPRMIKDPNGVVNGKERAEIASGRGGVKAQMNVCGKYARRQNAKSKGRGRAKGMTGDGDGTTSPPNGLGFSRRPCGYSFDKAENQFSKFQGFVNRLGSPSSFVLEQNDF
jgi:hypothetical protein